jgi:aerobic carbon-monoxide dehydrogenase medium subunit
MVDFDWLVPSTVEEACQLAARYGDDARFMAGGTALMLALRQRLVSPKAVISLASLPELKGVDWDDARGLRIGALTLHDEVGHHAAVQAHYPALAFLARHMANPQVRHQGTLGGNLCYGDPSTDPPTGLLVWDAEVEIASARARRRLPLRDFLVDYFTTALGSDELLVAVHLPRPSANTRCRYGRHMRTAAEHRPLVTVATLARLMDGQCAELRLAVGASSVVPRRLGGAESVLSGQVPTAALVAQAADLAAHELDVLDDSRGSAEFRRAMVRVTVQRELTALFELPSKP